jgi:hypothetical protein
MYFRRFFLLLVIISVLSSCDDSSGPLFVEYCIPVNVGDATGLSTSDFPPQVGVVINYKDMENAPIGGSSTVESFLIASEVPVTVIKDDSLSAEISEYGEISLAVVDRYSAGDSEPVAARLAYEEINVFKFNDPSSLYPVGDRGFDGILGGDILRRFAVRFSYNEDKQCTFSWDEDVDGKDKMWPNVIFMKEQPASSVDLGNDGFGVIGYDLAGGGDFLIGGQEHKFSATRLVVGLCVEPDPFPLDPLNPQTGPLPIDDHYPSSGVDMTGLVATGTSGFLTTSSGVERLKWRLDYTGTESSVVSSSVRLQGESLESEVLSGITRIVLVGDMSNDIGPCGELARRRGQEWALMNPTLPNPYKKDLDNSGGAILEVDLTRDGTGLSFDVEGFSPYSSYWQSIWVETTPPHPRVDFILGHDFLKYYEFTIDYINSRLIMRCLDYNCSDENSTCCNLLTGVCRCPENNPCCQYYKLRR